MLRRCVLELSFSLFLPCYYASSFLYYIQAVLATEKTNGDGPDRGKSVSLLRRAVIRKDRALTDVIIKVG